MKKKVFAAVIIILVALAVGALSLLLSDQAYAIPTSFISGRTKGAESAKAITVMINGSLKTLSDVSVYERKGDLGSAIYLIRNEINQTTDRQEQAHMLASAMEKMARAIPEIKPARAQQTALEAVSAQVTAVSHLVSYNEYLSDLFNLLNERARGSKDATTEKVQDLVKKLNDENNAIGELNAQFNASMREFDAIFQGKLDTTK